MENLERLLAEHPFLAGLPKDHLELLVGCAANVKFNAKQYLFREGEEAEQFFIIRSGKVAWNSTFPEKEQSPFRLSARGRSLAGLGSSHRIDGALTLRQWNKPS